MVESGGKLGWGMWILINFLYLNKVVFIYEVECFKSKNEVRNCDLYFKNIRVVWKVIDIYYLYIIYCCF